MTTYLTVEVLRGTIITLVVQARRVLDAMWWVMTGPHMRSIIKALRHKRQVKLEDISGRVAQREHVTTNLENFLLGFKKKKPNNLYK